MSIKILAIETSADETSVAIGQGDAIKKNFRLLSHVVYSQIQTHLKTGGIVPEVAARAHIPKIIPAIKLALKKAKVNLKELDAIAVTAGPGLITSLMIGVDTAKTLTFALKKPIIPVNHLEGHLLSGLYTKSLKSTFPALGLIVSGGHTILVLIKKIGKYKILGQTLDDAAGECFDKVARLLSLPYPGGPALSELAKRGNSKAIEFPRPMIHSKNYDFSFAGLKTAALYYIRDSKFEIRNSKSDIAASVQQAIIDVLVVKTLRAAKEYKVKTILLGGGVAANGKLRNTLKREIQNNLKSQFLIPNSDLSTDNAGMIALAAFFHYLRGHTTTYNQIRADPNLELKSWL